MFIINSNKNALAHVSNFNKYVNIIQILDLNIDKLLHEMSEEEIKVLLNDIKNKEKFFSTSKYDNTFIEKIKLIPFTSSINESDNSINIKIADKENILPSTSKFFIVEVENDPNYVYSSNKLKEEILVKKTNSSYFNLKLKDKNTIFVYDNDEFIVIFYNSNIK